jgi:hypothetical protein
VLTIYLDQNKWIDLTKALYRSDATTSDRENAESLKRAVAAGRLRFPVSDMHMMEAYRIGDSERRLQLASVFAQFSAGWFIASRQARVSHELDAALAALLSAANRGHRPCFDAFARDMFWAFGESSYLSSLLSIPAEHLDRISSCTGPIASLLSYVAFNDEDVRQNAVERMTASNADLMDRIRGRRAAVRCEPADIRFRMYSAQLFLEGQDKIAAALSRIGKSFQDLRALPDEQIAALIELVPCWDVERCLAVQLEQQWTRELEGNDVYDIAALTAAIPYCDVVVTERMWVHLCRVSGVAARYDTTVLSSVLDIGQLVDSGAATA